MSGETPKTGSEAVAPSLDWGTVCTAFERVSGIPSPLEPGEDVERHYIENGDPLLVYIERGIYGKLLGFAQAMDGKELPERPLLRGKIAQIAAKVSEAGKRAIRWEEAKKGYDAYSEGPNDNAGNLI